MDLSNTFGTAVTAVYIPIIARMAVGAALIAAGVLILVLGHRRWKSSR